MTKEQRATIPISEGRKGPERINFTKRSLENLKPPAKGRKWVYDEKTANLGVAVSYSGSKTFYWYGRVHGRPQRIKIGRYPQTTVEQARKMAVQIAGDIAEGKDPQAEKQRQRAEPTLGELFGWFLDEHCKPRRKERTWKEYQKNFDRYLGDWRSRKLSAITGEDVERLHREIGEQHGRYAANRTLSLLSAMYNKAPRRLWSGPNPAKGVEKFREEKRSRYLYPDELPRFFESLDAEPSEVFRDYFLMALLIGARRTNLLAMQWSELNLERGLWYLPDSKSGEPLVLHLPEPAVKILRRRQEQADGCWVFPSKTSASGHIEEPKAAWQRVCQRADLEGIRIHDLRRSLGSYMASGGESLKIVGRALGHRSTQATEVYSQIDLSPVQRAVNQAVNTMLQAGGKQSEPDTGEQ